MTVEEIKLSEFTSERQKREEAFVALEARIESVLSSPGPTEELHLRHVNELRYKLASERAALDIAWLGQVLALQINMYH